jgi:hypothetical protein
MKNFSIILLLAASAFAQSAHYRHHGAVPLNDSTVTPGDATSATEKQLCSPSFHTGSVRKVSEKTKHAVCQAYGLTPSQCSGQHVEIDHLISLELGGSNDATNLWPQPYRPPGAKQKDVLENALHRFVCAGTISLEEAQQCIAKDWVACAEKEHVAIQ